MEGDWVDEGRRWSWEVDGRLVHISDYEFGLALVIKNARRESMACIITIVYESLW